MATLRSSRAPTTWRPSYTTARSALPLRVGSERLATVAVDARFPPEGLDYHVCFGSDGNLRFSEIWDSREQLEAFGERLMPLLAEAGIDPGEPEVIEIHNIIKR